MRCLRWLCAGASALCLGLVLPCPSRADEEVARALLQSAKDAHDKKKYAEALTLLAEATKEAPELHEARYWAGSSHDKLGDLPSAVRAWREFRDALSGAAPASKVEADLLKKAQARLLALAPGEAEADKLRAAFASDLLAFAKSREPKDPVSALMALDLLLQAEPQHPEAGAAATRIRTPRRPGEIELPPALAALTGWEDVIAAQGLGEEASWTYVGHLLTLDIDDQSIPGPRRPIVVGGRCALDMELRVLSVLVPTWGVGFSLVEAGGQLVGVSVGAKELAAFRGPQSGPLQRLAETSITPLELKTWHRLSVQVAAPKVIVFLDGKKVTQFAVDNLGPETHMRLFVNRCKVEMRTLRWAVMR